MTWFYWFLCFLIGAIPAFLVFKKDRRRNIPVKWLPALLRFLAFFFTAALLLAPAFPKHRTTEEKPILIWLQDNSLSIKYALGKDSILYRKKTEYLWKRWKQKYQVAPLAFGDDLHKDSIFHYYQATTNMTAALQYVRDQYEDRNVGAIILSGDGVFNEGINPLFIRTPASIPVYTVGLGDSTVPKDALISRSYANRTALLHNKFELIADIQAFKLNGYHSGVSVIHNGKTIVNRPVFINSNSYSNTLHFEITPDEKGVQRYTIIFNPVAGEKDLNNNRIDMFVEVRDQETKILILAASPHPDIAAIKAALDATGYKVTIKYDSDVPADVNDYSLLIAHQVPSLKGTRLSIPDKMPVWYILGQQSDINAFNQNQSLLNIKNPGISNDALPNLNADFNYFALPGSIRELVPKLPPLKVPSGQYLNSNNAAVIFNQQIGNVTTKYPLWLIQPGGKPTAVLCGTGIWRWRVYENKYFRKQETVDDLIRKTVDLLNVKKEEQPFRVFLDKNLFHDNEPVHLYAELRNENEELINTPEARLLIYDTAGNKLRYLFEKTGHSYQINTGVLAPGDYIFSGNVDYNGKHYNSRGAFRVNAIPLERLRSNADFHLLYQLAHQNNGKFYTLDNMSDLETAIKTNKEIKPVLHNEITYLQWIDRRWFFFLIFLLVAAEWLLLKYWGL